MFLVTLVHDFPKSLHGAIKRLLKFTATSSILLRSTLAFFILAVSARTKLPSHLWQLYSHSFVFSASLLQSSILFFKFSISVSMLSISWCSPRTSLTTSLSPASKVPIVEEISLSSKLSSHCWTMCWNSLRFVIILVSDDAILFLPGDIKLNLLTWCSSRMIERVKWSCQQNTSCYVIV